MGISVSVEWLLSCEFDVEYNVFDIVCLVVFIDWWPMFFLVGIEHMDWVMVLVVVMEGFCSA